MEDWLFQKDDYVPKNDKNKFIDKSIFSILRVLSSMKRKAKEQNSFIYKLNPVLKLTFTILLLLLLSTSRSFSFILAIDVYYVVAISLLQKDEIKEILLLFLMVPVFTVFILIPSILAGNEKNSLLILSKIVGTVLSTILLSYTTKWNDITKALKLFFIPNLFILVFDITIKYIYILGDYALEMLYALKLRSIGRDNKKYQSLSQVMGSLFLKSKDMAEEMYSAMECRGFSGEYTSYSKHKFTSKDFVYSLLNFFLIFLYFYFK